MSLLLLFGANSSFTSTLAELITTAPAATYGYPTQVSAVDGEWRFVLELADPGSETVAWHDITRYYAGDRYQRGGDQPWGRFAASVAQVELTIDRVLADTLGFDINILAPWGQDTTPLFGADVRLDAGLLMRCGVINVVSGVVETWYPLWTGRVESWGDDSNARGQIRRHVVNVVDLLSDLANVPTIIPLNTDNWEDYYTQILLGAGWLFGSDIYGDTDSTGILQDLTPAAAIVRMDAGADPLGLAWRTRRTGKIIIYPAPWDTTNTNRWTTNPLLAVYPDGLIFSFEPDFTDVEYIADDDTQPFGVSRNIAGILNDFVVEFANDPGNPYLNDDPVSRSRYGVRPYAATWITDSPGAVDDLLTARAYASAQALPLATTVDHEGFFPALALVDHLDPVTVNHATLDGDSTVQVIGVVRNIVEERSVRFGDGDTLAAINWRSTIQIDINSTESAPALLPVEDLELVSTFTPQFGGPSGAEFSWTNPVQPDITPTNVQVRVVGRSLIWTDIDYPGTGADGVTVNWLAAATTYRFQVRLIRRVNGLVTAVSPRREILFTTPAVITPTPIPGTDPGDTNVIGTPPEGCEDLSVELQESADGFTWVTVDEFSGTELEINDDGTFSLAVDIDNSVFDDDKVYRFRTLCDGDVVFTGNVFDPPDSWDDPCTTPPALSVPPFDDPSLLVYVPKICAPDIIREAVSGIEAVHGDALAGFGVLADDPNYRTLIAIDDPEWSDTPGGILAYGECPQIVNETGDRTWTVRVSIPAAEDCVLFECGGGRLVCVPTTAGWRAELVVYKASGATITLPTTTVLDEGTEYVIKGTFELATGDLLIAIDGTNDNGVGSTPDDPTIHALPIWRVGAPPGAWVTDCAMFNSVIASAFSPDQLTGLALWLDGADTATITTASGAVSQWDDKSGNNRDFTQVNVSERPTPTTVNSLSAVAFSGGQRMRHTSGVAFAGSSDYTIFSAVKLTTTSGLQSIFAEQDGSTINAGNQVRQLSNVNRPHTIHSDSSVSLLSILGSQNFGTAAVRVMTSRRNGSTVDQRLDNTADGSGTPSGNGAPTEMMIGGVNVATQPLEGAICEICVYSDNLSDADRDLVITYLLDKWT